MKISKKWYTFLCDDVREEKSNKLSLIGLYDKEIISSQIPTILPQLCLVILLEEVQEIVNTFQITITSPKSEPIIMEGKEPPKTEIGKDARFILALSPFRINGVGEAKFEVKFNNEKKPKILHNLIIKKAT